MKWISVKERMPDEAYKCMVFGGNVSVDFAHYHKQIAKWLNSRGSDIAGITHWCQLEFPNGIDPLHLDSVTDRPVTKEDEQWWEDETGKIMNEFHVAEIKKTSHVAHSLSTRMMHIEQAVSGLMDKQSDLDSYREQIQRLQEQIDDINRLVTCRLVTWGTKKV